jgi:3D (Asp-Asp-Asp) domain-containing protein
MKELLFLLIFSMIMPMCPQEPAADISYDSNSYYYMSVTAYTRHPICVSEKYDDGLTASGTPVKKGVAAINVDYINNRWVINSPLELGQKVYIEDLGIFSIEDTGPFCGDNLTQEMWTIDIYLDSYEEAINFGKQLKKVYILD